MEVENELRRIESEGVLNIQLLAPFIYIYINFYFEWKFDNISFFDGGITTKYVRS
jgi:hypothetical protein